MSEWAWVALGYATTVLAVAVQLAVLRRRRAALQRRPGGPR